jgi:hypothetical protein
MRLGGVSAAVMLVTISSATCGAGPAKGGTVNRSEAIHEAAKAAAKSLGLWTTMDVDVDVLDTADVPNAFVFRARQPSKKGRHGSFRVGVVDAGGVTLGRDAAINRVLLAWGYGKTRSVPAAKVAQVIGYLEGDNEYPSMPLLDPTNVSTMREDWRPLVFLPRESTVDGHPAVEYWVNFGAVENTPPLLTRAQLIVQPDGSGKLVETRIVDLVRR